MRALKAQQRAEFMRGVRHGANLEATDVFIGNKSPSPANKRAGNLEFVIYINNPP